MALDLGSIKFQQKGPGQRRLKLNMLAVGANTPHQIMPTRYLMQLSQGFTVNWFHKRSL